jgi:hypothetical protein
MTLFEKNINFIVAHLFLEIALDLAASIYRFLEAAQDVVASSDLFVHMAASKAAYKDRVICRGC